MTSQPDDHGFDLLGYVDRTVDEAERGRIARHLERCPRCAKETRALEAGAEAARTLRGGLDETGREIVSRTLDRIAVERAAPTALLTDDDAADRRGTGSPLLRLVAGAVLVLGVGWASGWISRGGSDAGTAGDAAGAPAPGTVVVAEPPTHALLLVASDPLGGTMAERLEAYARWAGELRAADRLTMAEALTPTAYRVDDRDETPGAPPGPPDAVGSLLGFFLVRVPSDEAALEIARNSPHVGFGGEILVRPIYPTPRVDP